MPPELNVLRLVHCKEANRFRMSDSVTPEHRLQLYIVMTLKSTQEVCMVHVSWHIDVQS